MELSGAIWLSVTILVVSHGDIRTVPASSDLNKKFITFVM